MILPVYNAERFVKEAVTSILQQSFGDFELIIINDGSNDQSENIIKSITDPRIIFINNKINRGLIYTLNKGIQLAKGDYIARMDADDISDLTRFSKQVRFLDEHPSCAVIGSAFQPVDENNNPTMASVQRPIWPSTTEWFMIIGCPLAHPSVMYRASLAKKIGGYDPNYIHAEDYELWTRLIKLGDICSLPETLIRYRTGHRDRVSEKYYTEQIKLSNQIGTNYYFDHFGKQMKFSVSQILQNNNDINDFDKNNVCLQLFFAYQQLLQKYNLEGEAKKELDSHVFYYLKIISNQIVNKKYMIKVSKHPLDIRSYNKTELFLFQLVNRILIRGKKTKKVIARIIKPK